MPGENKSRDIETFIRNAKKASDEKWSNLDVMSIFGFSTFSKDGRHTKFTFKAPEGSHVETVMKEMPEEFLQKLNDAAYRDMTEKLEKKVDEKIEQTRKKLEERNEEEFPKPDKPVYDISDADMISFFAKVVRWVFKKENISLKGKNIWAIKKKGPNDEEIVIPPTKCPHWNEDILNSNYFFGAGKAYKFGNKLFRQKLQIANFMMVYGLDSDN